MISTLWYDRYKIQNLNLGYIPWDVDADLGITRETYYELRRLFAQVRIFRENSKNFPWSFYKKIFVKFSTFFTEAKFSHKMKKSWKFRWNFAEISRRIRGKHRWKCSDIPIFRCWMLWNLLNIIYLSNWSTPQTVKFRSNTHYFY